MKKIGYYIFLFYLFFVIGTMTGSAIQYNIPSKIILNGFLFSIFYILVGIPYNFSILFMIIAIYYMNEIKRLKTYCSFPLGFIVFLISISISATVWMNIKSNSHFEITFWNGLNFGVSGILDFFKLFILGIAFFAIVMIPIHSYFRKKFDFLDEGK